VPAPAARYQAWSVRSSTRSAPMATAAASPWGVASARRIAIAVGPLPAVTEPGSANRAVRTVTSAWTMRSAVRAIFAMRKKGSAAQADGVRRRWWRANPPWDSVVNKAAGLLAQKTLPAAGAQRVMNTMSRLRRIDRCPRPGAAATAPALRIASLRNPARPFGPRHSGPATTPDDTRPRAPTSTGHEAGRGGLRRSSGSGQGIITAEWAGSCSVLPRRPPAGTARENCGESPRRRARGVVDRS
jgi:hypothetical protein